MFPAGPQVEEGDPWVKGHARIPDQLRTFAWEDVNGCLLRVDGHSANSPNKKLFTEATAFKNNWGKGRRCLSPVTAVSKKFPLTSAAPGERQTSQRYFKSKSAQIKLEASPGLETDE